MTSGYRTSRKWCAPNQYEPTGNLRLYCVRRKKIAQSSANLDATDMNLIELPDLATISSKHIPILRFIPVKFG